MSATTGTKEHQNTTIPQGNQATDDKTSPFDILIQETKKLIKQGNYKKAYKMLQKYFANPKKMESIQKIKLCRRILASTIAICTKFLNRQENLFQQDIIQKLLEAGSNYLIHWHNGISNYVIKTTKKFDHFYNFLEEISNSSEEEHPTPNPIDSQSRKSTHRDSTKMNTPISNPTNIRPSKSEHQSSLLVKLLRNQDYYLGGSDNLLNNSFVDVEGSNVLVEEFTGNEINISFQLDEFFCHLALHLMNHGLLYKRLRMYKISYKYFISCLRLTKQLESTLNPNLLNVCARARIPIGVFNLEFGRYSEALEIFEGVLNNFQNELSVRFNQRTESADDEKFIKRVRKTIKLICMTLFNMAKCHELQCQFARIIECYKLADWFSKKFLSPEDSVANLITRGYQKARDEYGVHLEEVGEMERVIFENKEIVGTHAPNEVADTQKGYLKLQEQIYKKFDCSELNKRRLPVKVFQDSVFFKNNVKEEPFGYRIDDQNDFFDKNGDSTRNPVKSFMSSILGGGKDEEDSKQSPFHRFKDRKLPNKPPGKPSRHDGKSHPNTQRNLSLDSGKQLNDFEITESEEKACIKLLNRNIKLKKPQRALSLGSINGTQSVNSTAQGTPVYVDIDQYFEKNVENLINSNREEIIKPQNFLDSIRFRKEEELSQKMSNAKLKRINFKIREDLADEKINFKDILFHGYAKEKAEIQTTGYFIETQTQAENAIKSKINISRALSARTSPTVSKKPIKQINEQAEQQTEKKTLSSLIMKHTNELGLRYSIKFIKDMQKRNNSQSPLRNQHSLEDSNANETKNPEEEFKKIHNMVKDRIAGFMEDVELDLKSNNKARKRIMLNKSELDSLKPKEKFLKGLDELSSSCRLLSIKREASKRTFDFANVVRLQMKLTPSEKKKERKRHTFKTGVLSLNQDSNSSSLKSSFL